MNLRDEIVSAAGIGSVLENEPMKNHTSFRVGGNARYLVQPSCESEAIGLIELLRKRGEKFFVMGNGSNLLVSDKGYDGVIVKIAKNLSEIQVEGETIKAQGGALLSAVAAAALENELEGFEFASGIPGTIGGALAMNAGAYGGEIRDVIVEADVLSADGRHLTLSRDEMELGYRTSAISRDGYIVLGALLRLKKGCREDIKNRMAELTKMRKDKQPLNFPSAGSTFKRPEGHFAGKLISDAGLKGYSIGGACVSEKHAGFIVNNNDATDGDVFKLIEYVREKVFEEFGVSLENEVKLLGDF